MNASYRRCISCKTLCLPSEDFTYKEDTCNDCVERERDEAYNLKFQQRKEAY